MDELAKLSKPPPEWLTLLREQELADQAAAFEEWANAPERVEIAQGCFRRRCLPTADEQS
jgi:hypothetical protein